MVNIKELEPGMRVKIIDEWEFNSPCDPFGGMDRFLGTVMTIKSVLNYSVEMIEDDGLWVWYPEVIDEIVNDDLENDFEIASDEEFTKFIFG